MKFSITYQLFFSIFIATCLALLCMFLIMQWSINKGFFEYLASMGQNRLEQMAERLGLAYAEQKGWGFLKEDPMLWVGRLLHAEPVVDTPERLKEIDRCKDVPPFLPPPGGANRPKLPFVVLDAERKLLFGDPVEAKDINFKPIVNNNEVVGYIGFMSPRHFLSPPQLEFLKKQKSALALAALGMVLVVVIISIPLAKRMVRPIKAIATATHDLALGKHTVRVSISSSDELGQLARDFNAMALTLENNEKSRRQWVADISHELRTPLSVLRGEIEALLEGIRNVTPDAIRSLHAEVLRLHRLVDDLYQLALSDLGTMTYHKENLDLAEVLKDSIEPFDAEFVRKGIMVTKDITLELKTIVFADAERLHQLFSNLLDNSLKYTDTSGNLVIRLTCIDRQAMIDFKDSTPGVPEEKLDRLFDRLYRVEGSRSRASGGAGLGLAICKNIVDAHAGTISAHPSSLGGLMIKVTIPVAGGYS
ncbi:MAG: HAMP domain-containing protein [Planctomycetes bacterium]|nr:HAMP domain-containing protein [Planctomycetota bacterium]